MLRVIYPRILLLMLTIMFNKTSFSQPTTDDQCALDSCSQLRLENMEEELEAIKSTLESLKKLKRLEEMKEELDTVKFTLESLKKVINERGITVEKCVSGTCLNGGTCTDTSGGPSCKCAAGFEGNRCETKQGTDCVDVRRYNPTAISGVYNVYIAGSTQPTKVYCDMHTPGGPWTVIQRRTDGSEVFYRPWDDYKRGFGDVANEFWLGNDAIAALSTATRYRLYSSLRVDMEDWEGNKRYAQYDQFKVGNESTKYRLVVAGYTGNAGDSMAYQNGQMFSTYDRDNDVAGSNCAETYRGGWWYEGCHASNLNAEYNNTEYDTGVVWAHWPVLPSGVKDGHYYSLRFTEMKITVV